jgi:hypothetical protein
MKPGNPKGERIFKAARQNARRRWPAYQSMRESLRETKKNPETWILHQSFQFAFMEGVRYVLKKL